MQRFFATIALSLFLIPCPSHAFLIGGFGAYIDTDDYGDAQGVGAKAELNLSDAIRLDATCDQHANPARFQFLQGLTDSLCQRGRQSGDPETLTVLCVRKYLTNPRFKALVSQ